MAGKGFQMARQLVQRVKQGHEMQIMDHVRIAPHVPREYINSHIIAQFTANCRGLFCGGHKEMSHPRRIERACNPPGIQTIAIGFDHSGRFNIFGRHAIQSGPIVGDPLQINR